MSTRERLAAYAHEAWSGWMKHLFGNCSACEGMRADLVIPEEFVMRWSRQMNTAYADLPENEKDSDRAEADKMLAITGEQDVRAFLEKADNTYGPMLENLSKGNEPPVNTDKCRICGALLFHPNDGTCGKCEYPT